MATVEKPYRISVLWDEEAGVFVAHSDDILGLNTEAENLPELKRKVLACAKDLLEFNNKEPCGFIFDTQSYFVAPEALVVD